MLCALWEGEGIYYMLEFPKGYFEDEVRDGFYVNGLMKKSWAAQIEVLMDIDKVCRRHNIRWFADCGTLLGTVRHGGFIPWDDDLDICMFRDDYIKFLTVALRELKNIWPGYNILNYHNGDYWEMLSRVVNVNTINFDKPRMQRFHGYPFAAGVDIFPLDYVCRDKEEEEARKTVAQMIFSIADNKTEEDLKNIDSDISDRLDMIEEGLDKKFDRKNNLRMQLFEMGEAMYSLYSRDEADEVALMPFWIKDNNHKYPIKAFEKTIMLPYENIEIRCPAEYDEVLKIEYGDYMTIRKEGGMPHGYPYHAEQIQQLEDEIGEDSPFHKEVCKEDISRFNRNADRSNPREAVKKKAAEFVGLLGQIHTEIRNMLIAEQYEVVLQMLEQCQSTAMQIGTYIEDSQGMGFITVGYFEEYCELVYQIYQGLVSGEEAEGIEYTIDGICGVLDDKLAIMSNSIEKDIRIKKEIVFLPYKASKWEYMESLWRKKCEDPDNNVIVIPIPYYERKPMGELGTEYYEGDSFPECVGIINYSDYSFEKNQPDEVYIQVPYDDDNYTMSVNPYFYARNLKQYTDKLVYIPCFVLEEIQENDGRSFIAMDQYVISPGVVYADKVIVQSEHMKDMYIKKLVDYFGEDTREIWQEKIEGEGFPYFEKDRTVAKETVDMPDTWKRIIFKKDGTPKKVIVYVTGISNLMQEQRKMIDKMQSVFETFKENQDKIALIWRPDPLIGATISTLSPPLCKEYNRLVDDYKKAGWGIYDDENDVERLYSLADAYYGDPDKMIQRFRLMKIPIMLQNADI